MFQPSIQNHLIGEVQQPKAITFKTGQLFQGRITKIFPNHIATLTLGKMQLTARLEAALTVGQRYWFEVKDGTGLPQLKVVANSQSQSSEQILEQLNLPQKKEIELLLQHMAKKQIPFTREMISNAVQLLSHVKQVDHKSMDTIAAMFEKGIPISYETFRVLESTKIPKSLSELIFQLSEKLQGLENKVARKITELSTQLLQSGPVKITTSPIIQLLTMYAREENQVVEKLLTRLGLIQVGISRDEVLTNFQQAVQHPRNQHVITSLWPTFDIKSEEGVLGKRLLFESLMRELSVPAGKEGLPELKQLFRLFQTPIEAEEIYSRWSSLPNQSLLKSEERLVQTLIENSVAITRNPGSILKAVLSMVGYQYEHDLMRLFQEEYMKDSNYTSKLKALLIQLQEEKIPPILKEQAKEVVARITANQLYSQEQTTPLHQILLNIPLTLGSRQTDLTIKWEGKKMENGQLDPSYCRILFYLTLERLEETMVDVHVQNRIVTISIYNEQDKPLTLLKLLEPSLKERLSELHYHLFTVSWKKIGSFDGDPTVQTYTKVPLYKGVDLRI
ncbi:hypothetical protein [Halalkalibacter okhensis]|uniref:Flagellar hook-length control protein-like C-terminal domain-containing protein n=1 Tax=Halalkalibacter okhensis TaxID=333138 RepID=A0A0B0IJH2_9BACI|nr:hypothetical protein [Halalkalibacter okhensis]KHF39796.1 hypothetical protein LQ50_13225 [Halalkalibacter okhensis]